MLFKSTLFESDINCYKLRRIDHCVNLYCKQKKIFRELVRTNCKASTPPKYKRLPRKTGNKKEDNAYNKHYLRFQCQSHSVVMYDKTYQLQAEGLILDYETLPDGLFRIEVCCERGHIRSVEKKLGEPTLTKLLWHMLHVYQTLHLEEGLSTSSRN